MNFKRKYTSFGKFPIDVLGISDVKLFEDTSLDLLIFFPIVFYRQKKIILFFYMTI